MNNNDAAERTFFADSKNRTFNPVMREAFKAALKKADVMQDIPAMVLGVEMKKTL